jgi:hypothetical protein
LITSCVAGHPPLVSPSVVCCPAATVIVRSPFHVRSQLDASN